MAHFGWIVEGKILPRAEPDLQHAAFRQRHDLLALIGDRLGAHRHVEQPRQNSAFVKSHRCRPAVVRVGEHIARSEGNEAVCNLGGGTQPQVFRAHPRRGYRRWRVTASLSATLWGQRSRRGAEPNSSSADRHRPECRSLAASPAGALASSSSTMSSRSEVSMAVNTGASRRSGLG